MKKQKDTSTAALRLTNESRQEKTTKKSISLSDFLNRKIGNNDGKSIKEKQASFASIGAEKKVSGSEKEKEKESGGFVLDRAVFQRFNQPLTKESSKVRSESDGDGQCSSSSRKRKSLFGVSSGGDEKSQAKKYLVVLGDDPKPKPKRRVRKMVDERDKPFYNHYENGCGWWDGDREGVDSEEVGCKEVWEGMGSTTLGGLEWH